MKRLRLARSDWEDTPYRASKDTRKWCKGRRGIEHDLVWWGHERAFLGDNVVVQVCNICNKQVKWLWLRGENAP